MANRRWLFALLLAVPLIGIGVSRAVRAHQNSELRSELHKQYSELTSDQLAAASVELLCADTSVATETFCETDSALALMSSASAWAAGIGVGLLFLIWVAGRLSQNNRSLLVFLFRPGLYLTVLVLIGLVVTHAAIAMAAIYFGESALTNRIHGGIILVIGLGAAAGVLAMAKNAFALVRKAEVTVIGRTITRADAPQLWAAIERAAIKLGSLKPDHILVGLDSNFFVTEADVICLSGRLRGRTLYCSLPLARILQTPEFVSIVGHELGHFKGEDTKFSERFYPIYRGTASAIASLHSAGGDGAGAIGLFPAMATLTYFMECFSLAESRLSRDREFAADRAGADLTSAAVVATALIKVHAFADIWNGFDGAAADALREGKVYTNASTLFASAVARRATPTALEGIADTHVAHPTDSHPPLAARLRSLGQEISALASAALSVVPTDTMLSLIPGVETIEEEVSEAYQMILARRIGINTTAPAESGAKK